MKRVLTFNVPHTKYVAYDYEMPGDEGDPANFWHIYTLDNEPGGMFDNPSVFTMHAPYTPEMQTAMKNLCAAIDAAIEAAKGENR